MFYFVRQYSKRKEKCLMFLPYTKCRITITLLYSFDDDKLSLKMKFKKFMNKNCDLFVEKCTGEVYSMKYLVFFFKSLLLHYYSW